MKTRKKNKDRSNAKYSERDFLKLPEEIQLMLAHEYLLRPTKDFDDGTFRFSRAKFYRLCKKLGFGKTYANTKTLETHRTAYSHWIEAEGRRTKE